MYLINKFSLKKLGFWFGDFLGGCLLSILFMKMRRYDRRMMKILKVEKEGEEIWKKN